MPEIYHFHKRWMSAIWLSLIITGTVTHQSPLINHLLLTYSFSLFLFHDFVCFQDVSAGAGAVHRLPRVGRKVFSREGEWIIILSADVTPAVLMPFLENKVFALPSSDDRSADLWEVLSQQASLWKPLEAVLRLRLLPGEQMIRRYGFNLMFNVFCMLRNPFLFYCIRSVRKSWSINWVWIPICWSLFRGLPNISCYWRYDRVR